MVDRAALTVRLQPGLPYPVLRHITSEILAVVEPDAEFIEDLRRDGYCQFEEVALGTLFEIDLHLKDFIRTNAETPGVPRIRSVAPFAYQLQQDPVLSRDGHVLKRTPGLPDFSAACTSQGQVIIAEARLHALVDDLAITGGLHRVGTVHAALRRALGEDHDQALAALQSGTPAA
jgi:hypothetical protein